MAVIYTALAEITTHSAASAPVAGLQGYRSFAALEQNYLMSGMAHNFLGGDTVLEIEIKKSRGGRSANEQFTNQYLAGGNVLYSAAGAETFARALLAAERQAYPTSVEFMRIVIREINEAGDGVPFRSRSFPADALGEFVVPAGQVICPPHICAAVEKQAVNSRPGLSFYRHCVTTDEFDAYQTARTVPARFTTLLAALADTASEGGLRLAMPDRVGDDTELPRYITSFLFGGFRFNDPNRRKDSAKRNTLEAAQQQINEWARSARYAKGAGWPAPPAIQIVSIATALRQQAVNLFESLDADVRARIKWPAIFDDARVITGL
jgi:hypothetical protein